MPFIYSMNDLTTKQMSSFLNGESLLLYGGDFKLMLRFVNSSLQVRDAVFGRVLLLSLGLYQGETEWS